LTRVPIANDELVELTVERIGGAADGVAHWRGNPVYLPFTAPSERVLARLGARRGAGYEGRVVELLAPAADRLPPQCRHFGRCGGCALQHLGAETYQAAKLDGLAGALQRVGIDPGVISPLHLVPPARRRARLGLFRSRDVRRQPRVGFRQRFRHDLVDLVECTVLEPALFALVGGLRRLVPELLAPGQSAEASLTRTDSGIDLMIEAGDQPALAALEALTRLAEEADLARIVWRVPGEERLVVERRPVRVGHSGVAVPFPPGAFLQASEAAESILVEEVSAGIGRHHPALDLYAGLGSFAFALAKRGKVHAVEGDKAAAAALARAAIGVPGISVERRDLARDPLPPEALSDFAAAVFDPPRAGAASQARALAVARLDTVVAVSCNPATFARDAALLIAGGLHLEKLLPIDQFVWSPHLELVAVFRR
jgi:23S rRNA (uracil1939-C5)-methyltransferase